MLITFWLACGITAAIIANSRNRSVAGWLLLGIAFGLFALIVVIVLPALPPQDGTVPAKPATWGFKQSAANELLQSLRGNRKP